MAEKKYVYSFGGGNSEGSGSMKELLGGKGANLAEMASLGLPVPPGVKKIDLALKLGTPRFLEVVEELVKYMEIEKIHVAAEMQSKNEACWQEMHRLFGGKEWIVTDHEHFKQATRTAKAVIRTGETTPFANVILHSGVIF